MKRIGLPEDGGGRRPTFVGLAIVVVVVLGVVTPGTATDASKVISVSPRYGSLNGGTRITIAGQGFSRNQFNYGEGQENIGNNVTLVSDTRSYLCDIHKDGTHEKQITCYTRPMKAATYHVRVSVNGAQLAMADYCNNRPNNAYCSFTVRERNTPNIQALIPHSGIPGTTVDVYGKIFTAFYGSNILTENSTNGVIAKLLRAYMGGINCELLDELGNILEEHKKEVEHITTRWFTWEQKRESVTIGQKSAITDHADRNNYIIDYEGAQVIENTREIKELLLDGASGQKTTGHFKCSIDSKYIGGMNMSFIIENEYGRSIPALHMLRVLSHDKICMFESFAEVTEVSPSSGGTEGGTFLHIHGTGLDDTTDAETQVLVGGAVCDIQSVMADEIVCLTPKPLDSNKNSFEGNRGWRLEIWDSTAILNLDKLDEIADMNETLDGYNVSYVEEAKYTYTNDRHVARLSGYFVAPDSGKFTFYIMGKHLAKMYFTAQDTRAEIASITTKIEQWQPTEPVTLDKGSRYFIEILVSSIIHSESSIQVGVHRSKSPYNAAQTAWGRDEEQTITTSTIVQPEIQEIDLSGVPETQPSTQEVQTISIDATNTASRFRVGLSGVYTNWLTVAVSAEALASELSSLVTVQPDTVSVMKDQSEDTYNFTVTFISDRGSWPLISIMLSEDTDLNVYVEPNVKGVPSYETVTFAYKGLRAPPVSVDATATEVESAINELLSVKCPASIIKPPEDTTYLLRDYEDKRVSGQYYENGDRVQSEEAFCGHTSLHSSNDMFLFYQSYKPIRLNSNPWMCLAHRGYIQAFWMSYIYYIGEKKNSIGWKWFDVKRQLNQGSQWSYSCINLLDMIRERHTGANSVVLKSLKLVRNPKSPFQDIFVDALYIGRVPTIDDPEVLMKQRQLPPFHVKSLTVTSLNNRTYQLEMQPLDCYQPEMFSVCNTENVTVARVQAASEGVGGYFSLSWNGSDPVDVPAHLTSEDMQALLQTNMPGMGVINVQQTGDCTGRKWTIKWLTTAGELPLMVVTSSEELRGSNVTVAVKQETAGGLFYNPLPGHLLRTHHETPQVTVSVNGIPVKCSDSCSYSWDESKTPTVSAVSPMSGASGVEVTVTGTGFDGDTKENNVVKIGNITCAVSSATETEIVCTAGMGPAGLRTVWVSVIGKGAAKVEESVSMDFEYTAALSSISPTAGGIGGGIAVTVTGAGFDRSNVVKLDGNYTCEMESVSLTEIICVLPAHTEGSAAVTIEQNDTVIAGSDASVQFNYQEASTPRLTSQNMTSATALGGQVVRIDITNFGTVSNVLVGKTMAPIITQDTNFVTILLPPLGDGTHQIYLNVPGKGYLVTSTGSLPSISIDFKVTDVSTTKCSIYGGCYVTITGSGFPENKDVTQISFGRAPCKISSLTSTEVQCQINTARKVWFIDNTGIHPVFGERYMWNLPILTVEQGDEVDWSWEPPEHITGVSYRLEQTANATASVYDGSGFGTGSVSTPTGNYRYRFVEVGTFYYWSGPINSKNVVMRGVVHVVKKKSYVEPLTYKVGTIEPTYEPSEKKRRKRSVECASIPITECTNTEPVEFQVAFLTCLASEMTSISPQQGTTLDTIIITGSGFVASEDCTEVLVGGKPCLISSVTNTTIECKVDNTAELEIGYRYEVTVNIRSNGFSLPLIPNELQRRFVLLPHVLSVSSSNGSVAGGTELQINGGGFVDTDTQVVIDGAVCEIRSLDYTQIKCVTARHVAGGPYNVSVRVKSITAECPSNDCVFEYSEDWTPHITAVQPSEVAASTTITITGSNFGDDTAVVSIGDIDLVVQSTTDTQIQCTVGNIPVGDNTLHVTLPGRGYPVEEFKIIGSAVISSLSPAEGSLAGKTMVTIEGNGFVSDKTLVTIDGKDCVVKTVNLSSLTCEIPPHAAGDVNIIVKSNSISYPSQSFRYTDAATPKVTAIAPTEGYVGDTITITGSGFSDIDNVVTVGDVACVVSSNSVTEIQCVADKQLAGQYDVAVMVPVKGAASSTSQFTYKMTVVGISPTEGSFAGGQRITVSGTGLYEDVNVTVCDLACSVSNSSQDTMSLVCDTPVHSGTDTQACDVIFSYGTLAPITLTSGYNYSDAKTPAVTSVTPKVGVTSGGDSLTITGADFGADKTAITVNIDGATCVVSTVSDTSIECTSGKHVTSLQALVEVFVAANGKAKNEVAKFEYLDVWSSKETWGGLDPPEEGSLVVIPAGKTVMLDVDTPVLKMLLIQGGKVLFDEKDVELKTENILIVGGGILQLEIPAAHNHAHNYCFFFRHFTNVTMLSDSEDGADMRAEEASSQGSSSAEKPIAAVSVASPDNRRSSGPPKYNFVEALVFLPQHPPEGASVVADPRKSRQRFVRL
ncbi:Fibrocystin-L [Lamellibrachia satsuma]|nr:Fibrocystin-L [Lamellibrachia satsuma]